MNIMWTKLAQADLIKLARYFNNPTKFKQFMLRIFGANKILAEAPDKGNVSWVFGTKSVVLRDYPYVIFYRIWEDEFQVLRILHKTKIETGLKGFQSSKEN